jgi:hypothetical protein
MKRWRKKHGIFLFLFILAVVSPAITLLGTRHFRDKMHEQLLLKVMAERVAGDATSNREKGLRLFHYVHERLYTPPGGRAAGDSILEVLVRNVAWCSRQADILAMLARRVGVNGGYVTLFGYDDVSHHTVCALDLGGKLRMLDPFNGYLFTAEEGEIATLEDVRERGPKLHSPQFEAVKQLQGESPDSYFRFFEPDHDWEIHIPSAPMWLTYMDYYYDVFGDPFLKGYQDLYFRISHTDLFTRARMKQLAGRFESALNDYDRILAGEDGFEPPVLGIDYQPVTKQVLRAEAAFFRGQTYWDMELHEACLREMEEYVRTFPENRWQGLAYFYLGACAEKSGRLEEAAAWYKRIQGDELSRTPAPVNYVGVLERLRAVTARPHDEKGLN